MLPYLDNSEVPRVTAHALASMTNFLEHSSEESIKPYYQTLMEKFLYHLNHNIVFVKEAVLSALGALAEACKD